jgi:nitrite reductase/ring-hydroxylating ferredoxin subunit/uncharacterized membrane protein
MASRVLEGADRVNPVRDVGKAGNDLSQAIHDAVLSGGEPVRTLVDALHGTWLGHPLHPVLTDVTIGAWTLGAVFDAIGASRGSRPAKRTGDQLAAIGTASALPTALSGLADWTTFPEWSENPATLHAIGNLVAVGLYLLSIRDRRHGNRTRGLALSGVAFALSAVSGWLGGELVYRYRVGVNQADHFKDTSGWTTVSDLAHVPKRGVRCVEVQGKGVLLSRDGDRVCAIGAKCSHAGGPLREGRVRGNTVECPWHNSVFDLRNGSVVHGPATQPQPTFDVRVVDSKVQLKAKPYNG